MVLAPAQLVSLLEKYPRCAAASAPMASQTNTRIVPILRVLAGLAFLLVHIHPDYPAGTPAMPGRDPPVLRLMVDSVRSTPLTSWSGV